MKYMAIIDADEKPVSCEFIGCNGNIAPYSIGATTNIKALEQQFDDCVSLAEVFEIMGNLMSIPYDFDRPINEDDVSESMDKIKALPPVTPTQKWIPVSERLPEDRNIVLVTAYWHETYQVMMASYFGEGLWWCVPFNNCGDHMQKLNPKAWKPLPKPYEEK